nr:carboxypeptidase-like regulatory domain-containing protein [Deltaproteobacteria bacterium]
FTTNDDPGGQGGILGVVRQSDTNEWISGALIVVQCTCLPQARETTTNAQGVFAINGLPAGKYTVQVLAGRGDISRVIDLPQGKQARLNMAMRPDQEFIRT